MVKNVTIDMIFYCSFFFYFSYFFLETYCHFSEGMSKSHHKPEPVAGPSKKPTRREIYEFMIRTGIYFFILYFLKIILAGVRLEARNRTTCSAITTMHRLLDTDLASHICHYVNFLFRISFLFIILF